MTPKLSVAIKAAAYTGLVVILGLMPTITWACSVCYGNPEEPVSKGIQAAVFMMIGVTGSVFGGIIAFFVTMVRKSHKKN